MATTREGGVGRGGHVAVEQVGQVISVGMTTSSWPLVTEALQLVDQVTLPLPLPPGPPLSPLPPPPLLVLSPIIFGQIRRA